VIAIAPVTRYGNISLYIVQCPIRFTRSEKVGGTDWAAQSRLKLRRGSLKWQCSAPNKLTAAEACCESERK